MQTVPECTIPPDSNRCPLVASSFPWTLYSAVSNHTVAAEHHSLTHGTNNREAFWDITGLGNVTISIYSIYHVYSNTSRTKDIYASL
jgi:hypothetical protein